MVNLGCAMTAHTAHYQIMGLDMLELRLNRSLIIHPFSTIYAEFTDEERMAMNIRDTMIRLSVGIESAADLIGDIDQALSGSL